MTLEWVMHEIREAEAQPNSAKAVYDLAALLIVRNYLSGGKPIKPAQPAAAQSGVMDTAPTLDQVEAALSAITVTTAAERDRMEDAMTWGKILAGKE